MSPHSPDQEWMTRYSRQIVLKEIGGLGQKVLGQSVVGVIGAGGIASPLLLYLAASGVGRLVVVDPGLVEEEDLGFQSIYTQTQIGQCRAKSACDTLKLHNPTLVADALDVWMEADTVDIYLSDWDLMVVTTHSLKTLKAMNISALRLKKPLLAAWRDKQGITLLASRAGQQSHTPCLFCQTVDLDCEEEGMVSKDALSKMAMGVVGSILAMESLKFLLSQGSMLWDSRLVFHSESSLYQTHPVYHNPHCPACGQL